jgi:hypothetical protein
LSDEHRIPAVHVHATWEDSGTDADNVVVFVTLLMPIKNHIPLDYRVTDRLGRAVITANAAALSAQQTLQTGLMDYHSPAEASGIQVEVLDAQGVGRLIHGRALWSVGIPELALGQAEINHLRRSSLQVRGSSHVSMSLPRERWPASVEIRIQAVRVSASM